MKIEILCAIGDIVYWVKKGAKRPVMPMEICKIKIYPLNDDNITEYKCRSKIDGAELCFIKDDIGKTVFLTEAEAIQVLTETKLLPCSICKSAPIFSETGPTVRPTVPSAPAILLPEVFSVRCDKCGYGIHRKTRQKAIQDWNSEQAKYEENGWIPCDKRLPRVNTDVLVTLSFFCTTKMAVSRLLLPKDSDIPFWDAKANVVAWRPLPEPYAGI